MKYRENRRTGDKISEIGMGTAYIEKNASDCIGCGHCNDRCPFSVDQMKWMQDIRKVL